MAFRVYMVCMLIWYVCICVSVCLFVCQSDDLTILMYPLYQGFFGKFVLPQDDIDGILSLYGMYMCVCLSVCVWVSLWKLGSFCILGIKDSPEMLFFCKVISMTFWVYMVCMSLSVCLCICQSVNLTIQQHRYTLGIHVFAFERFLRKIDTFVNERVVAYSYP